MRAIIDLIITAVLLVGTGALGSKVYIEVKRAALTKAQKGLPSLEGFAQKLTGKKLDF